MARIGIDYTPAYEQGGGIGRLVRDLLAALAHLERPTSEGAQEHDYRLFIAGAKTIPSPLADNFTWKSTRLSPKWLARLWHRAKIPLPIETWIGRVDLYHATDFVLPPTLPNTKTIVTVHDLSFERVPEAASPTLRAYLQAVVPRSVRRANYVIADSQATKDDLIDLYNIPPQKISVLLSGIDKRYQVTKSESSLLTTRRKYRLSERPYLLSVGTVQPRKNYSRLIRALALVRQAGYDVDLVIAGGKGWLEDEMYQTIAETGMQDYVKLIGFADDADLPSLYSHAEMVVFPSLYEGFGFPVLEGMACGVPVITSNVSSLPEVAGNAAMMINPLSIEAIAEAIQQVLADSALRARMVSAGFAQVQRFTWEQSAQELLTIYEQVLHS